MAAKITEEVKEKAVDLRRRGQSYSEIVDALNGAVGIDWCKRNLCEVKKDKDLNFLVEQEVVEIARSSRGCTNKQIAEVISKIKGVLTLQEDEVLEEHVDIYALKKKIRAKHDDVLFRPEVFNPECPRYANELLLESAQIVHDTLSQLAASFSLNVFGSESAINNDNVAYEILALSYPRFSNWGVEQRCEYNNNVVEELEKRNGLE